jgi:uncharacterized UPF0160 family protein
MNIATKIVTHPGIFHADEVCAIAYLLELATINPAEPVPVERRNPTEAELLDPAVICVDVGGQFDVKRANFDHHQKGGAGERPNGVKYASFGLVFDWLSRAARADDALVSQMMEYMDLKVVQPVDALDNGQRDAEGRIPTLSFSAVISSFNPTGNAKPEERDEAFHVAVQFARIVLGNFRFMAQAHALAREAVMKAPVTNAGRVLTLNTFVPWNEHVFSRPDQASIWYVVFPSERGGFCIQQVPKTAGSFEGRKPLPKEWAGLREKALADLIGLKEHGPATFVHPGRFIGGAQSFEDAMTMADKAVEA